MFVLRFRLQGMGRSESRIFLFVFSFFLSPVSFEKRIVRTTKTSFTNDHTGSRSPSNKSSAG